MFSFCLSIFQYLISFLTKGQRLALVSNMWHGERTDIFPLSRLQVGVILRRLEALGLPSARYLLV